MFNRLSILYVPIFVGLLSLLLVFLAIYFSWLGETREGVMLYCEHARESLIKQPSNTFSNFGFVAIGLYIGYLGYSKYFARGNKMTRTLFYPAFFASVVVFLGPGSMAMHATNAYWGGFVDLMSMFLFSTLVFSYAVIRWFKLSYSFFLVFYAANIVVCAWVFLSPFNQMMGIMKPSEMLFGLQIFLATILELANRYIRGNKITAAWGWACIFTFMLAFFVWFISRTQDSWFCDPHSLIQGHAIWHLLNAVAALLAFYYYTSEEDQEWKPIA